MLDIQTLGLILCAFSLISIGGGLIPLLTTTRRIWRCMKLPRLFLCLHIAKHSPSYRELECRCQKLWQTTSIILCGSPLALPYLSGRLSKSWMKVRARVGALGRR